MADIHRNMGGCPADNHVALLSCVFCTFPLVVFCIEIWLWATNDTDLRINASNFIYFSSIFVPFLFCFSAVGLSCLWSFNSIGLVIGCIVWPLAMGGYAFYTFITMVTTWRSLHSTTPVAAYVLTIGSGILTAGSIHCAIILICLGFCGRYGGGSDLDLYGLEKDDSPEEAQREPKRVSYSLNEFSIDV